MSLNHTTNLKISFSKSLAQFLANNIWVIFCKVCHLYNASFFVGVIMQNSHNEKWTEISKTWDLNGNLNTAAG